MFEIIICILAGIGAGLGTGFAGMSAAVVITPMLVTFLNVPTHLAIGVSLASDVLASAISAVTYGRNKNIDIKNSKYLIMSVLVFTLIGSLISHQVDASTMGNFSIYMSLLLGLKFLLSSGKKKEKEKKEVSDKMKIILPLVCGALIGFVCGFLGAGGGIMMLLLLTTVLGYELKTAVGTSVFIMTFTALFGASSHFILSGGIPSLSIIITCCISTLIFALIGAKVANKVSPFVLNKVTGAVITTISIVIIVFSFIN